MRKILSTLLILPHIIMAQNAFFKSYGGTGNDIGENVISTKDGGFCMVGATESFGNGLTDLYVIKTDENGVVEWHSTFGGPNIDYGKSIVETNDSSFIACGYSNSTNLDYDIFVVKMDKHGNHIWTKRFGGSDWDFSSQIKASKFDLNHYFISGDSYSNSMGNNDAVLLKINDNGDLIWMHQFGGDLNDVFSDINEDVNGDLYCIGTNESIYQNNRLWISKLDPNGDTLWNYYLSDTNSFGQSLTIVNQKIIYSGRVRVFDQNDQFIQNNYIAGSILNNNSQDFTVNYPYHSTYNKSSIVNVTKKPNSNEYYLVSNYNDGVNDNMIFYASLLNQSQQDSRVKGNGNDYAHNADTLLGSNDLIVTGKTEETNLGYYDVFLSKTNGINWSTSFSNNELLQIVDQKQPQFLLYPNPVMDYLHISCNQSSKAFYIFNESGYLVKKTDGNIRQIDVSKLEKGVYFLSTQMNAEKNSICFMKL